jgi:hypothetical protein
MTPIGEFHCACRFYRAEEFGPAKLLESCAYHYARVRDALAYIKHVGANHTMRGEPHPQQWLVDKLEANLNSSFAAKEPR